MIKNKEWKTKIKLTLFKTALLSCIVADFKKESAQIKFVLYELLRIQQNDNKLEYLIKIYQL